MKISKKYQEYQNTLMMQYAEMRNENDGFINLGLGDLDFDITDFFYNDLVKDIKRGCNHYSNIRGDNDLIQEIIRIYKKDFDIDITKNELMVTSGATNAIWLSLEAILDEGDEVIYFSPSFPPYHDQIILSKGNPIEIALKKEDNFRVDFSILIKMINKKTKAIIINTPCNPTGIVWTKDEIQKLSKLIEKNEIYLIVDDIYGLFTYQERYKPIILENEFSEYLITIKSFSKEYAISGWRVGYINACENLINIMLAINENNLYVPTTISQRTAIYVLRKRKEIQSYIYNECLIRKRYMEKCIKEMNAYELLPVAGGIYLWIDISRTNFSSEEYSQYLLENYNILVMPGLAFGKNYNTYIRISIRQDITVLEKVISAMNNAVKI